MKNTLHELKIKKIEKQTADCVAISFDVPEDLQNAFDFLPGQYLALETLIDGEKVRRSYSLCSAPHEKKWTVAIKQVLEGKFSTFANEFMSTGDSIWVLPPAGKFKIETDTHHEHHYVGFAAGSGITPIMSMIKSVLHTEPNSKFTLFYGNRTIDSIIFREEIEALKNKFVERFSVHHILSKEKLGSPLFFGRIDGEKCEKYSKALFGISDVTGFYLCGPSSMIFDIRDTLISLGADESQIHFELFTTDDIPQTRKKEEIDFDPSLQSMITVILDGDSMELPLEYGGKSILDAAMEAGGDLPYACKGGVCSTCKARVTEGEVTMEINYALEPDEVENGFVLTCQAHPRSAKVTVDFDEA